MAVIRGLRFSFISCRQRLKYMDWVRSMTFNGFGLFCSARRVSARAICSSSSHFFQSVSWAVLFETLDADIKCGSTITTVALGRYCLYVRSFMSCDNVSLMEDKAGDVIHLLAHCIINCTALNLTFAKVDCSSDTFPIYRELYNIINQIRYRASERRRREFLMNLRQIRIGKVLSDLDTSFNTPCSKGQCTDNE